VACALEKILGDKLVMHTKEQCTHRLSGRVDQDIEIRILAANPEHVVWLPGQALQSRFHFCSELDRISQSSAARVSEQTPFGGRIVHGTITLGLIAPVIGMQLPGKGCVLLSIGGLFSRPVTIGDIVTAHAEVVEKDEKRRCVKLALRFTNQRGEEVANGEAVVKPPRRRTGWPAGNGPAPSREP
jgi:hypothetical protein